MKDKKNDLISPEIIKLTEKMAKDPASTLFSPLAEEYRKCGMFDEAIILLTDGLKNHPNFLSARVSLGKIYLQKGLVSDAKLEFEKVIQFAPDNLLAQKKLAMIYKDEGQRGKALESCRRLLLLNPNDEEIKKIKSELEADTEKPAGTEIRTEEIQPGKPLPKIEEKIKEEELTFNLEEERAGETDEKKEKEEIEFKSSPTYEIKDEDLDMDKDLDLKEIFSVESPAEPRAEAKEIKEEKGDDSLSDIFNGLKDQEEKAEEIPVYEIADTDEEVPLDNILVGREKVEEATILEEETLIKEKPIIKERPSDLYKERPPDEKGFGVDSVNEEIATEALAELYIRQEQFDKAVEILNILLSKDPSNETLKQKAADAATLKNLMGGEIIPGKDYNFKEEPLRDESVTLAERIEKALEDQKTHEDDTSDTTLVEGQEEDTKKDKKIKRLEQWLENIRRSHGNEL